MSHSTKGLDYVEYPARSTSVRAKIELDDITAARVEVTPLVPAESATFILNCYEARLSGPVPVR